MYTMPTLGSQYEDEDPIWWPAIVVESDDPEWRGRIKARVFGLDTEIITETEREGIKTEHLPWYEQVATGGSGITHTGDYGDIPLNGSIILVSWLDRFNKQVGVYWGHAPRSITDKLPNKLHGFSDPDEIYPRHDRRGTDFNDGIGSTTPLIDFRKRLKFPAYNGMLAAADVLIPDPTPSGGGSGSSTSGGTGGSTAGGSGSTGSTSSSSQTTPLNVVKDNAQRTLNTEWANNILERTDSLGDTIGSTLDAMARSAGLSPDLLNSPLEDILTDVGPAIEKAVEAIEKALNSIMGPCILDEIQSAAGTIANAATDLIRDTLTKSGCPILQDIGKEGTKEINQANRRVQAYVGEIKSEFDDLVGNPKREVSKALREATDKAFGEVNGAIAKAVNENPIAACVIDTKAISSAVNQALSNFTQGAADIINKALPTDLCDLTKKATKGSLLQVTGDQLKDLGRSTISPFTGG